MGNRPAHRKTPARTRRCRSWRCRCSGSSWTLAERYTLDIGGNVRAQGRGLGATGLSRVFRHRKGHTVAWHPSLLPNAPRSKKPAPCCAKHEQATTTRSCPSPPPGRKTRNEAPRQPRPARRSRTPSQPPQTSPRLGGRVLVPAHDGAHGRVAQVTDPDGTRFAGRWHARDRGCGTHGRTPWPQEPVRFSIRSRACPRYWAKRGWFSLIGKWPISFISMNSAPRMASAVRRPSLGVVR